MLAGPTRREDARGIAHHIHNQAGIIGNGGATGAGGHVTRLEQRVLLEGHAVLHRVGQIQRTGGYQFHLLSGLAQILGKNAADFLELAFIMRGNDDAHICSSTPYAGLLPYILLRSACHTPDRAFVQFLASASRCAA